MMHRQPKWFWSLIEQEPLKEGDIFKKNNISYQMHGGIPRDFRSWSDTQKQTKESFAFIWSEEQRFQSPESLKLMREWYELNFGSVSNAPWWEEYGEAPLVLEAGCGGGISAVECLRDRLNQVHYLGVDISEAVEAASSRFRSKGFKGAFLQTSLNSLPVKDKSIDVIFSQGVLHHTDSTEKSIKELAKKLKPGGRFLFYVYAKKGPIREFSDDYIRNKIADLLPSEMWETMKPLTKLGEVLGQLDIEIDIPENIELLEIPSGKINLQRFFYWHVFKAFYHSDLTFDEMNHINVDWYAPVNCHRHTPEEIRQWCREAGLVIEREHIQNAGISVVAVKEK